MQNVRLNSKVLFLQAINFIIVLFSVSYVTSTGEYYWYGLSFIMWFLYCPIGVGLVLHRFLTHKSFKTYKWIETILIILTVFSTVGPSLAWVALHRIHHKHSDTNKDPHTCYINGKFSFLQALKVIVGYLQKIDNVPVKFISDLLRNPIHKFIFNHYFKIIFVWVIFLGIINPLLIVFAYAVPASLTIIVVGLVNVLGHSHGYVSHATADKSTNSWIANIISFGEGWHNNHHANQHFPTTREQWWEWDVIGIIIKFIEIK